MADQILRRRASPLSNEEKSFIIVYSEVNINRKSNFACYLFYCYLVNGKKMWILVQKTAFFGEIFMILFDFMTFILELQVI
jgi:hypothetical protein